MSEKLKRYGWVGRLLTTAVLVGVAWGEIKTTQQALAARLTQQEKKLASQEQYFRQSDRERGEILVTLGRLEERLKAVQERLERERR